VADCVKITFIKVLSLYYIAWYEGAWWSLYRILVVSYSFWCNDAGWPWRHKVLSGVGVKTWDVGVLDGVPSDFGLVTRWIE